MSAWTQRFIIVIALISVSAVQPLFADAPNVTAVLSNSEAVVGETVQMQVKITGGRSAEAPDEISVDGLEIHRTGTEQQYQMNNFQVSSSVIYDYTILPMKAGSFKIPPQTIKIDGKSLKTPELTLHITDAEGGNASNQQQNQTRPRSTNTRRYGFLDVIVPKTDAYVGEMIPVEVKLGLGPQTRLSDDLPDLNVQGLTFNRSQKPEETVERVDGITYHTLIFKGAIAAVHPGKLDIPPLQTEIIALVPRQQPTPNPGRRRSPFDDPFFSDPFEGLRGQPVKIVVKSEPVTLEIKPLPPNPPASFSGAVGTFTMNSEAKPKTVQIGDPITITATISGRGNFDRMTAPGLEDERGWHKYPPSGKFVQNDDVGLSGTKTFETVISPNEKKSSVPPLSFSYFDPLKEKYVTLRSDAVPIEVEGNAVASTQPPAAQSGATQKPQDILYQLTDRGRTQSFASIYTERAFWFAQLAPLAGLIGFCGWKIRKSKIGDREVRRLAALQHESAEVERKLRRKDLSPQEYFGHAARAVRLKTALAQNIDPNTVDADLAARAFALDPKSQEQLRRLFDRSDELRYSGSSNGSESVSSENRHEVLELIENLR